MKKACQFVSDKAVVLDVGADHGFCALYLSENGHKVYASEVKQGPFEILKTNLKRYGSNRHIEPLLMDGLDKLPPDVDTVLILGMGGKTIFDILKRAENKLSQLTDIIIEPQSDFKKPISYLLKQHFFNIDGCYIYEKHYYPILRFTKGETDNISKYAIEFGPVPFNKRDPLLYQYLKEKQNMIDSLPENIRLLYENEAKKLRLIIHDFETVDR